MATLAQATQQPDMTKLTPVSARPAIAVGGAPAELDYPSEPNPFLRCPLPSSVVLGSDSLRQFYRPGIPQYRTLPPPVSGTSGGSPGGGVGNINIVEQISNGVAAAVQQSQQNTTVVETTSFSSQLVSFNTPTLAVGAIATGTIGMAKSFILLQVAVSLPARVRLYSTAAAQAADLNRPNSVPPTPGLANGVISDHYLTGAAGIPLTFPCSPIVNGGNGDNPQSSGIYISVTNIGAQTTYIQVTLTYVPTEA